MKNRIIYLFIMLVGVLACSDEFTETPAYGALSPASLQNATGVDLALIGAYSLLDGNSNTGGSDYARAADGWWSDVMSDDAHKGSTNSDQPSLFDFYNLTDTPLNRLSEDRIRPPEETIDKVNAMMF